MIRAILVFSSLAASVAAGTAQTTPYAGLQDRSLKALSDEQVSDLRDGRGMGYALAAELNGFPGPIHVLELADALALTPAQLDEMRKVLEAMRGDTIPLGERLIEQEIALDRQFREERATSASIAAATRDIATTQSELRARHLSYHLVTKALLKPGQIELYQELRGYELDPVGGHGGHGAGHKP